MKVAYLGAGTWGFALASLLVENGHEVCLWSRNSSLVKTLQEKKEHPKLLGYTAPSQLQVTGELKKALQGAEVMVESVTSSGVREVFGQVVSLQEKPVPIVLTSKGIEQGSGLLLCDVVSEVLQEKQSRWVGALSGPSHAEEVIKKLPTSVVAASFDPQKSRLILDLFQAPHFRVYPNPDIRGVLFGGAMKNIIAIACGISDGLGFGDNTKAALMTRGLHEMRKLSVSQSCQQETLNGLSGLGDLCVTCLSKLSRNYRFGRLIAEGYSPEQAKEKIGMVVEGAYTCVSALELGEKYKIAIPITEVTYAILYEGMNPSDAVKALLQRAIKEEHL